IRTGRGDMVPAGLYQALSLNSEYLLFGLPPGIWTLVFVALVVGLILRSTVFGRYSFALGSNEATARLCGINVSFQKVMIYALSGALIGLAGVFQFSRLTVGDPESGLGLELKVIAAVVIGGGSLTGGRGSIAGTLCGAIMLAVILNGCTQLGLPVSIEKIVVGSIIIFAVFLDQPVAKQFLRKLLRRGL
ncbi:MAG: ABC transporter permease, partial [Planctomycetota bacterium]|nr:ABC transporter permease [Planctomycetota bacterium]